MIEIALSHKVGCMWHMDKTPLYFDMPFKGTIDTKGRRRIYYLNTEKERKRAYVVLYVSEYGHKLHPMLVVVVSSLLWLVIADGSLI